MSALPLQPSRLNLPALRCGGTLHLSPWLRGPTLRPASPELRTAGDAKAGGTGSYRSRAAEMGGFIPYGGLSQGGVQA